ncbi:MAG: VWA domain-containing protein, partial [Chloroflexus sp.]
MAYEADPFGFIQQWHAAEESLAQRIAAARTLLPQVRIDRTDMAIVASLCIEMGVDGHRADLTILETARTHAAWSGRRMLLAEDIRLAAELALPHRMRRQPFGEVKLDEQRMASILDQYGKRVEEVSAQAEVKKNPDLTDVSNSNDEGGSESSGGSATVPVGGAGTPEATTPTDDKSTGGAEYKAGDIFKPRRLEATPDRRQRHAPGRRSRSRTTRKQGRYITSRRAARVTDLALDATLREAAIYQRKRRTELMHTVGSPHRRHPKVLIKRSDLRQKVRVRRTRNAVCFVVDASWSMAAEERMQATKAAVLSLLRDAYQRRDQVGLVSFQRDYARVLLPLTNSVELAQRRLQSLPTGGKTPLSRGLITAFELLE